MTLPMVDPAELHVTAETLRPSRNDNQLFIEIQKSKYSTRATITSS